MAQAEPGAVRPGSAGGLPGLARELESRLDRELSPRRATHSRGVAGLAAELCARHGLDPEAGRVAGLAHDLCKEWPEARLREAHGRWAATRGRELGLGPCAEETVLASEILHGPAAARLLEAEYGPLDPELLDAVALHTVGHPGMGLLAILVYCADKMEPGRKHVGEAFRSACLAMEPRAMLLAVVEDSIRYLGGKGRAVAPSTLILYNALRIPVGQ